MTRVNPLARSLDRKRRADLAAEIDLVEIESRVN
eukprot:COSAG05_NODE_23805_length_255_cov_1.000000_1_plen_33_part_10